MRHECWFYSYGGFRAYFVKCQARASNLEIATHLQQKEETGRNSCAGISCSKPTAYTPRYTFPMIFWTALKIPCGFVIEMFYNLTKQV